MTQASQFTQTSFNYLKTADESQLKSNLDRDLKMIFTSHGTLNGTAIKAPAFGAAFSMASGVAFVKNGQGTFTTGLSSVAHVVVTADSGNGVALNIWLTAQPAHSTPGLIDIFIFQPTSNVDNTPVIATGTAYSVHWIATGTSETTT